MSVLNDEAYCGFMHAYHNGGDMIKPYITMYAHDANIKNRLIRCPVCSCINTH